MSVWNTFAATAYLLRLAAKLIEEGDFAEEAREVAREAVERMVCSADDFRAVLRWLELSDLQIEAQLQKYLRETNAETSNDSDRTSSP